MIYLDYAATSLKRVELIEYIMNNMTDFDANADSIHKMGRLAKKTLENSRHEIAKFLNTRMIGLCSQAVRVNPTIILSIIFLMRITILSHHK